MLTGFRRPLPVLASLMIFALFFWAQLDNPVATEKLERANLDFWFHLRGPKEPPNRIVLLAIDDASLQRVSGWPWSREKLADLLAIVLEQNPRLVVFDQILPFKENEKAGTSRLAGLARQSKKVLFPVYFGGIEDQTNFGHEEPTPEFFRNSSYLLFDFKEKFVSYPPSRATTVQSSALELAASSLATGHINIAPEEFLGDKTVRWEVQIIRYGDDYFPSLPIQVAAHYWGFTRGEVRVNIGEAVLLGARKIPTDSRGWSLINYYGPAGHFPAVSAAEVLQGKNLELLRDRIVLLGLTAAGSGDFLDTPLTSRMPGVEKLATSLANVLDGSTLIHNVDTQLLEFALLLLCTIVVIAAVYWLRKTSLVLVGVGLFIAVWLVALGLLATKGWWIRPVHMQLAIAIGMGAGTWLRAYLVKFETPGLAQAAAEMAIELNPNGTLRRVGHYEVVGEIGAGAMGKIYEGLDPTIQRRVAIKMIRQEVALMGGEKIRERFLREAQAAGGLSHPNIVTIYHAEQAGSLLFMIMEYLDGKTLEHIIAQKSPMTVEQIFAVIRPVCDALQYAHERGVIHRDIKPGNIMITRDGIVKVMDFGIAHLSKSTMTMEGAILGTPSYMSPEQISGEKIDARTDIFALGVIIYEMATGMRPFDGESLQSISHKILAEHHRPAMFLNQNIPPAFDEMLQRALAKDRTRRFPSADKLADEFRKLIAAPGDHLQDLLH